MRLVTDAPRLVEVNHENRFHLNRFYRRNGHRGKARPAHRAWWLEHNDTIMCALRLEPFDTEQGTIQLLRGMWAATGSRGQGYGSQLLTVLRHELASMACYCMPYLPQKNFYLRNGFETADQRAPRQLQQKWQHYLNRGEELSLMRYQLSLPE
ncbi:MAG: GNAT family N-acetyltransferase [Marinobacterium sp.]|nr:GNAT family N-acetyltransferase [Marinobacterium sp.]